MIRFLGRVEESSIVILNDCILSYAVEVFQFDTHSPGYHSECHHFNANTDRRNGYIKLQKGLHKIKCIAKMMSVGCNFSTKEKVSIMGYGTGNRPASI